MIAGLTCRLHGSPNLPSNAVARPPKGAPELTRFRMFDVVRADRNQSKV